jgi:hypothetical protein
MILKKTHVYATAIWFLNESRPRTCILTPENLMKSSHNCEEVPLHILKVTVTPVGCKRYGLDGA